MSGPQPLLGPSGERDVLKGTLFGDHRTTRAPTIAATRTAATTIDRRLTRRLAGRPRDAYVVTGLNYDRRIDGGKDRLRLPFAATVTQSGRCSARALSLEFARCSSLPRR